MSRTIKAITVIDVEKISYRLALDLEWREPIPPMDSRFPGKLESSISAPFQTFGGRFVYRTIPERAAALFYFMIKNHPFQNGNKRMALTTLLVYLFRNGYWIKISPDSLYDLAIWVAASPVTLKDDTLKLLHRLLRKIIIKNT